MSTRLEGDGVGARPDDRAARHERHPAHGVGRATLQPRILIARTARALGLDARQASRLRRALREERLRRRAVRERLAECRIQLREALASPAPDPGQIWELAREERVLLGRERSPGLDLDPAVAAILNEEQVRRLRRRSRG